jgi:hypothetical protein
MNLFKAASDARDDRIELCQTQEVQQPKDSRPPHDVGSVVVYQTAHQIAQEAGRLRAAHRYWQRTRCPSPVHRAAPHEQSDDAVRVLIVDPWLLFVAFLACLLLFRAV